MEVMVSITMLAFISLGIITLTKDAGEIKDTTVNEDAEILQVEKAFYRFAYDFEQIYSPFYFSNEYTPSASRNQDEAAMTKRQAAAHYTDTNRVFNKISESNEVSPIIHTNSSSDQLAFFTMSNRRKYQNAKESTYAWVLYTLEKKDIIDDQGESVTTQAFVRYYSAEDPYGEAIWNKKDNLKSQILLTNVDELEFSYWDKKQKKFTDSLIGKDGANAHTIQGVQIKLTWVDRQGAKNTTVRFFRPGWDSFEPETDREIKALQAGIQKYAKKPQANTNAGDSGE